MLSIHTLLEDFRAGKTTPAAVADSLITEIARSEINSYISVNRTITTPENRSGRLYGIPIAIKDLIDVKGMKTTMGSEQYANNVASADAEVVARLRAEGAIIIGKANTHEFAYGSSGDRSFYGAVRNPHDTNRMSGGSSSGSAAAVAAGLCAGALGTDTAASIRLPSSLCGIVGMKPTFDVVSRVGVFPLSRTLDHVGPMTSDISDNALLLEVLTAAPTGHFSRLMKQPIKNKKIGLLTGEFFEGYLDAPVRTALEQANAVFRKAGATVVSVAIPQITEIYNAQQLIIRYEAYRQHHEAIGAGQPYSEEVLARLKPGATVTEEDYQRAMEIRGVAMDSINMALDGVDLLISATTATTAPLLNERTTTINGRDYSTPWLMTRLTAPTNLSGHPSLSVPFGNSHGLPIGIQLTARHHDEAVLYQYGKVLEDVNKPALFAF